MKDKNGIPHVKSYAKHVRKLVNKNSSCKRRLYCEKVLRRNDPLQGSYGIRHPKKNRKYLTLEQKLLPMSFKKFPQRHVELVRLTLCSNDKENLPTPGTPRSARKRCQAQVLCNRKFAFRHSHMDDLELLETGNSGNAEIHPSVREVYSLETFFAGYVDHTRCCFTSTHCISYTNVST